MRTIGSAVAAAILLMSPPALAKHNGGLPPGLQKKVAQGQPLPPGWQKKLQVGDRLDDRLYRRGEIIVRDDKGLVTIRIDGKLVELIESTREVVKIL